MPSVGHVAVGLAVARRRKGDFGWRSALLFSGLALLPDLDVLAFRFGIPYGDPFGHRGASHSLAVALSVAALAAAAVDRERRSATFGWAFLAMGSHGVLDTLTDGGLGVALLWPFTAHRYFAPFRPIPVAPIGIGLLGGRGLRVIAVELALFSPAWVYALFLLIGKPAGKPADPKAR